ncbi:VRR-NUC domain-containing protein [Burkholderia gladioli]|uniref:VRR-NUC domain-containing protein n=1 Tax=Burkholderia gladioli TaxID=28095 RepID=UPI00163EE6E4|nr:VRR-NUC domain-containing protein [Burkholderia gladioli]
MLEKTVEAYLVERVRALGGTAYKFTSPARASVPDRIVILPPGRIFFVEVKRPGGKLTRGQEREHEHLHRLGADVRVLDSIGAINAFLNEVQAVAADGAQLDEDRIDWIANAHCPGGTAYPVNVKNAIREALREARAAVSPATAESKCTRCGASTAQACNERGCFYLESGEGEPATADERAAFERWMVEDEKCIVGSADPYPAGIERQNWKVWRAAWARASQAAAPADHPCIAPACGVWDGNSECTCKKAAAPADAREPGRVGRADIVGGRVHSFAFEQTDIPTGSYSLYTAPVSPPC